MVTLEVSYIYAVTNAMPTVCTCWGCPTTFSYLQHVRPTRTIVDEFFISRSVAGIQAWQCESAWTKCDVVFMSR